MSAGKVRVWSIGHSNHTLERFLDLVVDSGLEVVVDVRSTPRSGFAPWFDREELRASLAGRDLGYVFLG